MKEVKLVDHADGRCFEIETTKSARREQVSERMTSAPAEAVRFEHSLAA
jgi:hypothetical protein